MIFENRSAFAPFTSLVKQWPKMTLRAILLGLAFVLALRFGRAQEPDTKPQPDVAAVYQAEIAGNSQALQQLRTLATEGNSVAQYDLGLIYENGSGVSQDYAEAIRWYRKSADQGIADAQYNLGYIYASGQEAPQDFAEAIRWYRKSADQGIVNAQYNLGYMYASGEGAPENYIAAAHWFHEAADQGEPRAQYSLGTLYAAGHGVPQDYVYAHMWFNLAASRAKGDDEKQYAAARDSVAARMTPQELADAHKLAREWQPKE
jgi:TPR repeat protein